MGLFLCKLRDNENNGMFHEHEYSLSADLQVVCPV
jgi:hypothetical protein